MSTATAERYAPSTREPLGDMLLKELLASSAQRLPRRNLRFASETTTQTFLRMVLDVEAAERRYSDRLSGGGGDA